MTVKLFIRATVPREHTNTFLQWLRDFDVAHAGCHFEIAADAPDDLSLAEIVRMVLVEPELSVTEIYTRKPAPKP